MSDDRQQTKEHTGEPRRRTQSGGHNFRKLIICERALRLTTKAYALSHRLPRQEEFGLKSQLRRAAVSVVLNIAEGSGASSNKEFVRFLEIARRSLYEVDACLQVSVRMGLIVDGDCRETQADADELAAMISGFRSRLSSAALP